MIIGNIEDLERCKGLEEKIRVCLDYARDRQMEQWPCGSYAMENGIRVNINEYQTAPLCERKIFEAHKKYMDLQLMLLGREFTVFGKTSKMETGTYDSEHDIMEAMGEKSGCWILEPGDFIVCDPEDAHKTGILITGPCTVKKAVFKIPVTGSSRETI
ncbi:MAG: YhcH/YjgK/YiaL family protein [Fusicatenibacter sp.]|nr:YhcH/YjgK/YiaL family protein [Fusicatenibacter sp.]